MPVYETVRAIAGLEVGKVLRVMCTDAGSMEDFRAFARGCGRVAKPFGFALTDPYVRLARIRLLAKVDARQ